MGRAAGLQRGGGQQRGAGMFAVGDRGAQRTPPARAGRAQGGLLPKCSVADSSIPPRSSHDGSALQGIRAARVARTQTSSVSLWPAAIVCAAAALPSRVTSHVCVLTNLSNTAALRQLCSGAPFADVAPAATIARGQPLIAVHCMAIKAAPVPREIDTGQHACESTGSVHTRKSWCWRCTCRRG